MSRSLTLTCASLAALLGSCAPAAGPCPETKAATLETRGEAEAAPPERSRPRVVVAVVVDQLASEELLRLESLLDPKGGLGRAVHEGTFVERARYPYAATLTGPGHASLFTGVPPEKHGVSANELWDYSSKAQRAATFDPRGVVLGFPGHAGPAALRSETVAEVLLRASEGRAKAVAFSLKDRGAIFPLGRAGLALWYEPADGSFTTSATYANALPTWLKQAQESAPVSALLVPWTPLDAARIAELQGADDQPWESDLGGFGRSFPHDPRGTKMPYFTLRYMPSLGDRVLDLGRAAIEGEGIGKDDVPDLLVFSLSGLDYAGHAYGPRSWEYADHVMRVDRALGSFLDWLGARASVALAVSADHGVAPAPESVAATEPTAGRIYTAALVTNLEAELKQRFGAGPWVESCLGAFVYLSEAAKRRSDVLDAVESWLGGVTGVARAVRIASLSAKANGDDPLAARIRLSLGRDVAADFYLVQKPYTVFDGGAPPGIGSHHGSPYPYDTDVPVLLWGTGVERRRTVAPVDALRFAATLADLLGVPAPVEAAAPSLL